MNFDKSADEFDKLLDEFLNEEIEACIKRHDAQFDFQNGAVPEYYSFRAYKSRGTEYSIPTCHKETFCEIDDSIEISVDKSVCRNVPYDTTTFFVSGFLKGKTIHIGLNEISMYMTEDKLLLALYAEGTPEPLAIRSIDGCNFETSIDILCDTVDYTYGNYFLLVCGAAQKAGCSYATMGDNIRFNFSILQHGEDRETAKVNSIGLTKKDNIHGSTTSGTTTLEISFDSKQTNKEEFTICCTTGDYRSMCAPIKFHPRSTGAKKIKINISSKYIWLKERYNIYLLQNNEPIHKAAFAYDGEKFALLDSEKINKQSQEYLFMKHLLTGSHDEEWKRLSKLPGLNRCKETIASNLKPMVVNDMRQKFGLKTVSMQQNYIVEFTDNKFLDVFVALATNNRTYKKADCAQLIEPKYTADPYEESNDFINSCRNSAMVLCNVGSLLTPNGGAILGKIEKWFTTEECNSLILCGTESECKTVIETAPFLQGLFPEENIVRQEYFSAAEQIHCLQDIFEAYDYFMSEESEPALVRLIENARSKGDATRWRSEELKRFFKESIYPRILDRTINTSGEKERNLLERSHYIMTIEAEDFNIELGSGTESEFERSMMELNSMVGLNNLKEHFRTMFNYMQMEEIRRSMGLPVAEQTPHHMIFTGNPGTGKTTVAKKIGKIFRSLGLLSKGEVIITERAKIIGRYIGETERNMQRILEQARGNVLFIDEAYTLCEDTDDKKDFGQHAIDALLTVLAQPNPDTLIIMAGYQDEMDRMMRVNQGLQGRFPHKFHFDDYSEEELMQIATAMLDKNGYSLDTAAREALLKGIGEACKNKDQFFSNARWMGQVVMKGMLPAMSARIMSSNFIADKETFTTIKEEDVRSALDKFRFTSVKSINNEKRQSIGFAV